MGDKARLVIDDWHPDRLRLGWDFDDGEGVNAWLGESLHDVPSGEADTDAAELAMAEIARRDTRHWHRKGRSAWWTPSMSAAKKALVACRAAIRAAMSKKAPLEDWEKKALAAGWKPPKGRL